MKQSSVRFGGVLVACLAAALIETSLAATSHTVGGSSGWAIPSSSTLYSTWASQQTFKVGDSLVFNFQTGSHTVAEVSKSAYDACTTSNPISTSTNGPATITIGSAGNHYYICTFPGHCGAGQKLAITATGRSSAATPASSPAPSTATPTSSPTSSPSPATSTAPTPSSPGASTVPLAKSPTGGAAGPSPSSANFAGAGLVLPFMMTAAAFLV